MKSTLYLKFVIIYIVIGFIGFFSIVAICPALIADYLIGTGATSLYRTSSILSTQYLPGYFSDDVATSAAFSELKALSSYTDSSVWFVDAEGSSLLSAKTPDGVTAPGKIADFNPAEFSGKTYMTGNYHGYFSENTLSVLVPVVQNYSTKGYLLLHKPLSRVLEPQSIYMRYIYLTFLIVYGLSFLVFVGFHFIVYRPLKKITEAAKQYASGNLDFVIPVTTNDEIGYLSASLNYMSSQLKDMNDYQKKFIANVSHDFRSPLTSIKGYVEAMADGTIPPEMMGKYLQIILFETERLTGLTQDLLTLNAFDSKKLLLSKQAFDIHSMIRQTATSFEGRCTEKKISFELLLATRTLNVFADPSKIQQVLHNLIDNAIKFSNPNSTIVIETTERGDKAFISVKDSGIGIPKQSINKIWDRFYKTDLSRGKDKKGTGLGLSIVKEIIQTHDENISVISTEGVGTEFVFSLPKAK